MNTTLLPVDEEGAGRLEPIGPDVIAALEGTIGAAGLSDVSLHGRYSVVFAFPGMGVGKAYPELAGCTMEVCTFIDEIGVFAKHGIAVIGLSGELSEPPPGCLDIPFPVGIIAQDEFGEPIRFVEQDGRRYAERTSFLIYPDGSGLCISGIADVVGHVRRCLKLALEHRLDRLRRAALETDIRSLYSTAELRGLLPNGADSVAISRVDVTIPLVVKMATPAIVAQEAGYMRRINSLLEEASRPRLFPAVVAINAEEDPAWYLMEAADPVSLDRVLFADAERSVLDPRQSALLATGVQRLADLHELTFRRELPPVAPYHYRGRFAAIPARTDTQLTCELLTGWRLEEVLERPLIVDGLACRPYPDQLACLTERINQLAQPVGAYLHGDAHLPNMLVAGDGVVFVDPRVVWDGNDVGDPGFGDPLYDYATLLHSVHVMSTILHAVNDGQTERLLTVDETDEPLRIDSGSMRVRRNPVVDIFRAMVADHLPPEVAGTNWEARLHVGTANALLGWLKYARSVQTRHAWLAIYGSVLYHLEVGRRLLTQEEIDS